VPRDDEVSAPSSWVQLHFSQEDVVPGDEPRGYAKPPGERAIAQVLGGGCAAVRTGPGVGRPLVFRVRRAGRALDVGTRARAGIHALLSFQAIQDGVVEGKALGLDVRGGRTTDVRSLIPIESQPVEVQDRR